MIINQFYQINHWSFLADFNQCSLMTILFDWDTQDTGWPTISQIKGRQPCVETRACLKCTKPSWLDVHHQLVTGNEPWMWWFLKP